MVHVVALLPGFLGFNHLGARTYFADRFVAGLRACLESRRPGETFIVAPCNTWPIGSLASRQALLKRDLQTMQDTIANRLGATGKIAWHLVGHSTGGLDAALFIRTDALAEDKKGRSVFGARHTEPNRDVRSVTTFSAPHYGTALVCADLPAMTRGGPVTARAVREALRGTVDVLWPPDLLSHLSFGLGVFLEEPSPIFLARLLAHDALAADLDPLWATGLTDTDNRPAKNIPIFSIATVAPRPIGTAARRCDRLFRDIWRWTGEKVATLPPPPQVGTPGTIIHDPQVAAPSSILPDDNDGVVNTCRQVDPRGVYAGLVVGDHADVMGRYSRSDLLDGKPLDTGLFTSGASFDDPEFFKLLHLIADGIVTTV